MYRKVFAISIALCLSLIALTSASDTYTPTDHSVSARNSTEFNKRYNISFVSCLDVDSNEIEKVNNRGDYRFKNLGENGFNLRCTDLTFAPDTTDLNYFFRQSVKNADSSSNDTLQVIKCMPVKFEHGFYGLLYHFRVRHEEGEGYDHIKIVSYSYGEMFGDFIYHNYEKGEMNYKEDSTRVSELFKAYTVYTMEEIRKENYEIRKKYKLTVDSLPFNNYWIQINRVNGNMVRDTVWMEDLDSVRYMPSLTYYNITYRGRLNISPAMEHTIQEFVMDDVKSVEISDSAIIFEVRDTKRGDIRKKGTLIIENSIGYPLELSFYYSYHNILLDMLYQKRP